MATARAACVVGWPVEHSRSPLIHNYWLKHYGIAGEYRREAVPPEALGAFLRSLAARGYVGANVTVPHKEPALALSEPDDRARTVGAAKARKARAVADKIRAMVALALKASLACAIERSCCWASPGRSADLS